MLEIPALIVQNIKVVTTGVKESTTSSAALFKKLQEETQATVRGEKGPTAKKQKTNNLTAAAYKLS